MPQRFIRGGSIYEGTALSPDFLFTVTRTWRGEPRNTIELQWPRDHACSVGAPVVGNQYIIHISCAEPDRNGVFACKSGIFPLDGSHFITDYLQNAVPLSATDLAQRLRAWEEDPLAAEGLREWVLEMSRLAEVNDWYEHDGKVWSLTLASLYYFQEVLFGTDLTPAEFACVSNKVREDNLSRIRRTLELPSATWLDLEWLDETHYAEVDRECELKCNLWCDGTEVRN